jgi:hypothetical protein
MCAYICMCVRVHVCEAHLPTMPDTRVITSASVLAPGVCSEVCPLGVMLPSNRHVCLREGFNDALSASWAAI